MHYFQGMTQANELLKYKIMNLEIYLKKYQSEKEYFKIYTNQYFTMDKIKDAVKILNRPKLYSNNQEITPENLNITGLIFYPHLSNARFIFNNKKIDCNQSNNTPQNVINTIISQPTQDKYKLICKIF